MPSEQVTVLGGGSFGTAIANIVADNGLPVKLWMRDAEVVDAIRTRHENPRYLPGKQLNPQIVPTTDLADAVEGATLIFVAIPSKAFRTVLRDARGHFNPDQLLVSTTKGIEEDGFLMMSQILAQETPCQQIGVLSGPNLAKEIANRMLTGTVIASESEALRTRVQQALSCKYFRVYANNDVFGGARWRTEKHLRHCIRHGVRHGHGRKHQKHADHPQPGGNEPLCRAPGWQSDDLSRSGRGRGSVRYLYLAVEPQFSGGF